MKKIKIIVCVDNVGGILFNGRRQSQDAYLIQDIVDNLNGRMLYISEYSENLFFGKCILASSEDFLSAAGANDFCFVETADMSVHWNKVNEIIIYRWNRTYPADAYFFIPSDIADRMELLEMVDFAGKSHEKITKEVYRL